MIVEAAKPLAAYRREELEKMRASFYDPDARYHRERQRFVYKGKVPLRPAETLS